MERIDGYCDIDYMRSISKEIRGCFSVGWYTDELDEYLFKEENDLMAYKELFYSKIIKKIGLKSAEYDLAVLGLSRGVITKNYNLNHNPSYTIEEILDEYEKVMHIEYAIKYNLENLPEVIRWFCKEKNWIYSKEIEKELYIAYIMQILLGNSDLKSRNLEVQYNQSKKNLFFSPFYDFSYYGTISVFDYFSKKYSFLDKYYKKANKLTPEKMIQLFLKYASRTQLEILREYLEKLHEINLDIIIEEIENQTEHKVNTFIKRILICETNKGLNDVERLVNQKK